jgi:hypothetical protein
VKQKTEKEMCCGNCKRFKNKDVSGFGWCAYFELETKCDRENCYAWCLIEEVVVCLAKERLK